MIRFFIYLALLTPLSVSAAEMSGQRLLEICLTNHPACGAFVREVLRDWPDKVIDEPSLKEGKVIMYRCPQTLGDEKIARFILNDVHRYNFPVGKMTGRQLATDAFARSSPNCARSSDI